MNKYVEDIAKVVDGDETADLVTVDWPVLSPKAMPGIVGDFVRLATENSEADPAAVLATFLVRFGVEIGSGPHMWIGDTAHRCRFASVIVGDSSKARKGTSGKPVKKLFSPQFETPGGDIAQTTAGPFSSGEGIIYAIRDEVKKFDEKAGEEVVADPGVADKRLFVLDEEFSGVMAQTKREGNTLSMVIRQLWDSGTLSPLIKHNRTSVTDGHVGWVSHITLFELNTRLDQSEAFNGFANRILWVCAKRPQLVAWPEPMDNKGLHSMQVELFRIIAMGQKDTVIKPDRETKQAWVEKYYPSLAEARPGLLGSVTNRGEAQVLRLSMLYALIDGKAVIELPHLEAAVAFWNYCDRSARFIFNGRSQDNIANKLLDGLQDGEMTGTEINRLFGSHVSKDRLETALSELLASGRITRESKPTGGRPSTIYKINSAPRVKSVKSVLSPQKSDDAAVNTHNTLNTQ